MRSNLVLSLVSLHCVSLCKSGQAQGGWYTPTLLITYKGTNTKITNQVYISFVFWPLGASRSQWSHPWPSMVLQWWGVHRSIIKSGPQKNTRRLLYAPVWLSRSIPLKSKCECSGLTSWKCSGPCLMLTRQSYTHQTKKLPGVIFACVLRSLCFPSWLSSLPNWNLTYSSLPQ